LTAITGLTQFGIEIKILRKWARDACLAIIERKLFQTVSKLLIVRWYFTYEISIVYQIAVLVV
jgi:hypothetical protein